MKKPYLVIRVTLGEVIVLLTRGKDKEDACQIAESIFEDFSGMYFTIETTEDEWEGLTWHRQYCEGSYQYNYSGNIIGGSGFVFIIATGKLNDKSLFKKEIKLWSESDV